MEIEPRQDSLIEYPCLFPIKVMGVQHELFLTSVADVARQFDPQFDSSTIEERPSRSGKYMGLTLHVTATSREQLDQLYLALTGHPDVKVVL